MRQQPFHLGWLQETGQHAVGRQEAARGERRLDQPAEQRVAVARERGAGIVSAQRPPPPGEPSPSRRGAEGRRRDVVGGARRRIVADLIWRAHCAD